MTHLFTPFLLVCCFQSQQLDLSTPKAAARTFAARVAAQKWDAAAACVLNGKAANAKSVLDGFPKGGALSLDLRDLTSETQAETATVTGNLYYKLSVPGQPTAENTFREKLELARSGDKWLIVASKMSPGMDQVSPLAGLASLFAYGTPPEKTSGMSSQTTSAQTQTLSNLKQIGLAALIYSADYDNYLPRANWRQALMPYIKNDKVFKSPMDKPGKPSGYNFNELIYGRSETSIAQPAATVMAYEGAKRLLAFLYNGKGAVVFVDGHAKMISKEEAKKLRWKP